MSSFEHNIIIELAEYFSKANIQFMDSCDYDFVMMVKDKLYADDDTDRCFHIYYKAKKQASERARLEADLDRMEDKISQTEEQLRRLKERCDKASHITEAGLPL
ncbi:hypothetical protein ACLUXJ_02685 [Lactobacillus porci]|uniref:hypothetical protein n=1 Tax=Lactobacillus porci TaxID=2012477 RepID=UPI0039921F25